MTYNISTELSFPYDTTINSFAAVEVRHEPRQIRILGQTAINTGKNDRITTELTTL
jgi:hypothetical protein